MELKNRICRLYSRMPEPPLLRTCCFYCSLEVGSIILGWIMTIFSILGVIVESLLLIWTLLGMKEDGNAAVYTFDLIRDVIVFFLSVYLLIGITKLNMRYVLLRVLVFTIYEIIASVFIIIVLIAKPDPAVIIVELLQLIISGYFILVVYTYYRVEMGRRAPTDVSLTSLNANK